MEYWWLNAFIIIILSALFAGVLIPQILLIAYRRNLFDEVDERKIHKGQIPRLGGMAFVPVIFISLAALLEVNRALGWNEYFSVFSEHIMMLLSTFISLEILYLVGIADDLIGVKYKAKFFVQIVCAALLIAGGVWFQTLGGVLGLHGLSPWFAYPFTAIVMVFLVNAINLIDGIDGLCSGLCSIACIIYGYSFMMLQEYALAMISFATLGVLFPFFYYNVFGDVKKHSKIFMGDTGSLTIGIILSVLGVKLYCMDSPELPSGYFTVMAFSPLIVPCFDVVRVYVQRLRQHRSPFMPDKTHIHHRLLAAGMKPRAAMITIVGCSALLSLFNTLLIYVININFIVLADVVIWGIFNYYFSAKAARLATAD